MTVPLRIVLAAFIGLISISSAIIAFTPTYLQSLNSVDEVFTSLRASLVSRATSGINSYFTAPVNLVKNMEQMIASAAFLPANMTTAALHETLCSVLAAEKTNAAQNLVVTVPSVASASYVMCDRRGGALMPCHASSTSFRCFRTVANTFKPNYTAQTFALPFSGAVISNLQSATMTRQLNTTQRWIDKVVAGYTLGITAGAPYYDPITNTTAIIMAETLPSSMNVFLNKQLGLSVNSRATIVHRTSKVLIANSWDAPVEFLNLDIFPGTTIRYFENILLPDAMRSTFRTLTNMSEPLMNQVLAHIGGESGLYGVAAPYRGQIGSGREAVYFSIDDISDSYGLRLRLVVAVPAKDYTAQLYDSANVVYGAVSGATAGMIVCGAIFAVLLTSAIARIGQRMELAAEFRDNEPEDALSVFGEIAAIQVSFRTMKGHLTVMKAYLPAAVLATLLPENSDDDDDGEEGDEDAAEGDEDQKSRLSDAMTHVSSISPSKQQSHAVRKSSTASAALTKRSAGTGSVASRRVGGGQGGGMAKLASTVSVKSVSVLCVNLRGWHTLCRTMTPSQVTQAQERYLSAVFACAREEKGVVDFFSGDRVLVTFNAVSSCPGHPRRAANAAYAIRARLCEGNAAAAAGGGGPALLVTAGISSGNALVGNVGSSDAKRFNVMGTVYSEAIRLEQVARGDVMARELGQAPILVHRKCLAECVQDYTVQFLGVASLDGTGDAATRSLYAALESKKKVDDDEWMYQLEQGKSSDPFAGANDAFIALFGGGASAPADDAVQAAATLLAACNLETCVGARRLLKCIAEWRASPSPSQQAAAYVTISAL